MVKKIEVEVRCPTCGLDQLYHSHQEKTERERRKTCNRCGKNFSVRSQRVDRLTERDRKRGRSSTFVKGSEVDR